MTTVLSITGLCKQYGHIQAVNSLSLTVEKGQVYGLLGPNGSGKTTTLGIILGVIRQNAGVYQWFGQPKNARSRRKIGSLLEQPNFYPWLSAMQNLKIVAGIRGEAEDSIENFLKLTSLWEKRNALYNTFSLGMKQRLGLCSTLLGDPDVLVLDEPANGVDAQGIADIRRIILDRASEGKTIIMASHILDEVEKVCTHVGILKAGELLDSGSISSVLSSDDTIEVAAEDMQVLASALGDFPGIKGIEKETRLFRVAIESEVDAGSLNHFLTDRGIFVSHLSRRKRSLESHFLELLNGKS